MKKSLELSVHQLVDFLLRTGDIDTRVFNRSSMSEGSRIHSSYQSKQGSNYLSEYPLKHTFVVDEIEITLQGRADGIIKKSKSEYVIDEIKTTIIDLKEFRDSNLDWHLGQAKCYAYMFALEMGLDNIGVKLTYIKQGKESEKLIDEYLFLTTELENDVRELIEQYLTFYNVILRLQEERDKSISTLNFPYDNYRKGQKELTKYVYGAIKNKQKLFIEAPTGIGKTMSCLYPSIKFLAEDDKSKVFYLTAKATGKENAHKALTVLKENGLSIADIIITSKEKICFCKDKSCNPDECIFAKGYYNKIKNIIKESIVRYDDFDYELITYIANKYSVCPFELELDLSLYCDVIVCDFNYVFDPTAYMKRYFDEDSSHYLVLVDEAHNLVDRSKEMYSASISLNKLVAAKEAQKKIPNRKIKNALAKLNKVFEGYGENAEYGQTKLEDLNDEVVKIVDSFVNSYQEVSKDNNKDITKELVNLYLDVMKFQKIYGLYSERFLLYFEKSKDNQILKIYCLDASKYLSGTMSMLNSTVMFSATLSPIEYYVDVLGGDKTQSPTLLLDSPFPKENLKLLIAPKISTRYKNRDKTYADVARYISAFVGSRKGNYFVYLPSYEYLAKLMDVIELPENVDVYIQQKDMSEKEKNELLSHFNKDNKKTVIAFAIIGGAFGEGIDLVGDSLIGVVIVGIGLPKINFESNEVVEYYKANEIDGFNYAYTYPGMNKVMQAVGRLIRTETDKGAALLIDERYCWNDYRILFKKEWNDYELVYSEEEIKDSLQKFFKN